MSVSQRSPMSQDVRTSVESVQQDLQRAGATREESAAVAAALAAHLDTEEHGKPEPETWTGRRFQFAGRLSALLGDTRRVPCDAPTDEWTAAGRADRFER